MALQRAIVSYIPLLNLPAMRKMHGHQLHTMRMQVCMRGVSERIEVCRSLHAYAVLARHHYTSESSYQLNTMIRDKMNNVSLWYSVMPIVHGAHTYQLVIDRRCQLILQPHRVVVACPHGQKRAKHVGAPIAVVLPRATYAHCHYRGWLLCLATAIAVKVLLSAC